MNNTSPEKSAPSLAHTPDQIYPELYLGANAPGEAAPIMLAEVPPVKIGYFLPLGEGFLTRHRAGEVCRRFNSHARLTEQNAALVAFAEACRRNPAIAVAVSHAGLVIPQP